jgi:tetratricopeptide (TPR) repeat protein
MRKAPILLALLASVVLVTTYRLWTGHSLSDPQVLLDEAKVLAAADPPRIGLAQRKISRALSLQPIPSLRSDLIRERAGLRGAAGSYVLALEDWEFLLAENPGDIEILDQLGSLAVNMGDRAQAIERYAQILSTEPKNGYIRAKLGQQQVASAQESVDVLHDQLFDLLPRAKFEETWPLVVRALYLPFSDPAKDGILVTLDGLLSDRFSEGFELIKEMLPPLYSALETPRASFVASIESSVNEINLLGVIEQLMGSGRLQDTADFGITASVWAAAYKNTATMQTLAIALEKLGRSNSAAAVIEKMMRDSPEWHPDYLLKWCEILFRAEKWTQLKGVAWRLGTSAGIQADGRALRAVSDLYSGLANCQLDSFVIAEGFLNKYMAASIPEPFPSADALALIALADCHRASGTWAKEKGALERCIAIAPDFSADVYKRAAESIRKHEDAGLYEANYLAHAIRLDSSLADELLPLFEVAGAKGIAPSRYNIEVVIRELTANGEWYSESENFAFMLWHLAKRYLNDGEHVGALHTLRKLRRDYPGFVPAYDLENVILLSQGRHVERADGLLERMSWSGPEPELLLSIKDAAGNAEGHEFDSAKTLLWMQLDPSFTGSIEIAKGFLAQGKFAQAYTALRDTRKVLYTDSDRLLFGQVLSELEQYEGVIEATAQVNPASHLGGRVSLLRARAALFLGRPKLLEETLTQIEANKVELDTDRAREVLDLMIGGGLEAPALRLATHLVTSEHSVSGRNLNLAAVTSAIIGNSADSREWVELANAFLTDNTPTLGLLLLNLQEGDLDAIAPLARELRDAEPAWAQPAHPALLAALEGRLGEARALTLTGLEGAPHDPIWHLLGASLNSLGAAPIADGVLGAGLGKGAREPLGIISSLPPVGGLELTAMLLALDAPEWSTWTDSRLGHAVYRNLLGPYAIQLMTGRAIAKGELAHAKSVNNLALKRWPVFTPFWDQLEEIAVLESGSNSAPEVATVRRRRQFAQVPPHNGIAPTEVQLLLDSASRRSGEGMREEALEFARKAVVADATSMDAKLAVARLAREVDPLAALNGYVSYLAEVEAKPHFESDRATEELIAFLNMRGTAKPSATEYEIRRSILERIVETRPHDPLPVIELSRLDVLGVSLVDLGDDRLLSGLGVALSRMATFYRAHNSVYFQELRAGSVRSWFEFLLQYDPDAALIFANDQLSLSPQTLELWVLHARGLEAVGFRQMALDAWRQIGKMTSDPEVALETARLVGEVGGEYSEVNTLLLVASRSPNRANFAQRLDYYRARALVALSGSLVNEGVELLERLLAEGTLDSDLTPDQLNYTLGLSLIRRGQPGDGPRAYEIFSDLAQVEEDPLRKELLRALSGLGNGLDYEIASRQNEADLSGV